MLTENRKRRHGCEGEGADQQLNPQAAKRSGGGGGDGHDPLESDPGRGDVWDSEHSSSSDCSGGTSGGTGSPAGGASTSLCSATQNISHNGSSLSPRRPEDSASAALQQQQGCHDDDDGSVSYHDINRVLREAHFSSRQQQTRGGCPDST